MGPLLFNLYLLAWMPLTQSLFSFAAWTPATKTCGYMQPTADTNSWMHFHSISSTGIPTLWTVGLMKRFVRLCLLANLWFVLLTCGLHFIPRVSWKFLFHHNIFFFDVCRRTDLKQLLLLRRAWIWKNARSLSKDLTDSNRSVQKHP